MIFIENDECTVAIFRFNAVKSIFNDAEAGILLEWERWIWTEKYDFGVQNERGFQTDDTIRDASTVVKWEKGLPPPLLLENKFKRGIMWVVDQLRPDCRGMLSSFFWLQDCDKM